MRRKGEELTELKSGNMLYYRGTRNGRISGVGFLIHKRLKDRIVKYESASDRVAKIELKISKRNKLQILQVYAPTISHSDEEIEAFYEDVTALHESSNVRYKIVMGDFNANGGEKQQGDHIVVKFCLGNRNERGHILIGFAEAKCL